MRISGNSSSAHEVPAGAGHDVVVVLQAGNAGFSGPVRPHSNLDQLVYLFGQVVGNPPVTDLAGLNQAVHGVGDHLHMLQGRGAGRRLWTFGGRSHLVGAVQQVNVDVVGVQAFEAGFGFLGQDLLGETQGLPAGGSRRGLGGDHHLAAQSGDAVPQCGFGSSHSVAFGGVEEVDADIDAVPYQLVSLGIPALAAEMAPEGRALAVPGDVEVGVAELHQVRGTADGFGRRWRLLATGQWSQHHGAGSRSTGLEEGPAIGRGVDGLGKQGTLGHCGLPF